MRNPVYNPSWVYTNTLDSLVSADARDVPWFKEARLAAGVCDNQRAVVAATARRIRKDAGEIFNFSVRTGHPVIGIQGLAQQLQEASNVLDRSYGILRVVVELHLPGKWQAFKESLSQALEEDFSVACKVLGDGFAPFHEDS